MTAVLRLSSFVFCLPKLAHRANQCYHTLYIPSAFPSKVLGVGCWVLGFATPPAQHPTPNTRAYSALGRSPRGETICQLKQVGRARGPEALDNRCGCWAFSLILTTRPSASGGHWRSTSPAVLKRWSSPSLAARPGRFGMPPWLRDAPSER